MADAATAGRYYEQHKDRFTLPGMAEAEHILFAPSPGDEFASGLAVSDAHSAIRKLQTDPGRFAELARQHSACSSKEADGNLDQVGPGPTVAESEEALFGFSPGELCPQPVKTRFGVLVIRAGRCIEGRQPSFELVRDKVTTYLEEARWHRAVSQYLAIPAVQTRVEGVALEGLAGR